MGVSLPLLARALTTTIERAAVVAGGLYGWNTLGAAFGAFATTWWMLPLYGLESCLQLGALLNLLAAAIAIPLAFRLRRLRADAAPVTVAVAGTRRAEGFTLPFAGWAVIYALTGFLALSLEIVWFRLMAVMQRSTAFTFGTLLALYLTGLGLGSLAGSALVRRTRRPGNAFLAMQAAVVLYAGLAVTLLIATLDEGRLLSSWVANAEPVDIAAAAAALRGSIHDLARLPDPFLVLYFGIPAILILPPTLMMGAAFPLLQRAVQTDLDRVGTRIGTLLMVNIAGAALGSFVTGWWCLDWLGTSGTLKLLVVMSVLFPLVQLVRSFGPLAPGRFAPIAAVIAASGVLFAWMPDAGALWASLHGARPVEILWRGRLRSIRAEKRAKRLPPPSHRVRERRDAQLDPVRRHSYSARRPACIPASRSARRRRHLPRIRRHAVRDRGPQSDRASDLHRDRQAAARHARAAAPRAAIPRAAGDPGRSAHRAGVR